MTQLEVDHCVGSGQRIDQQPLETLELLLRAHNRALLLLELVEELETLATEPLELALHARSVPIELQQLLYGFGALLLEERSKHGRNSVYQCRPRLSLELAPPSLVAH